MEGMARVYGHIDNVHVQYVASCLEQAGFHPTLYARAFNPGPGMYGTTRLLAMRNYGRTPLSEIKVFVPYAEVTKAEETIRSLNLTME